MPGFCFEGCVSFEEVGPVHHFIIIATIISNQSINHYIAFSHEFYYNQLNENKEEVDWQTEAAF